MRQPNLTFPILLIMIMLTSALSCVAAAADVGDHTTAKHKQQAKVELQLAMRTLWEDHINYTRTYIISALADLPDAQTAAGRLLANQDQIGDAIKPFYGDAAGEQLSTLLRDHITIATQVIAAAKTSDSAALADAQARWEANADEIAAFLAGANPNWNEQELKDALHRHLELTAGEVTSRLAEDWAGDIQNCDANHAHMLMFADMLTDGIAAQFPQQFK